MNGSKQNWGWRLPSLVSSLLFGGLRNNHNSFLSTRYIIDAGPWTNSLHPPNKPLMWVLLLASPSLQMRKMRLREVRELVWSHKESSVNSLQTQIGLQSPCSLSLGYSASQMSLLLTRLFEKNSKCSPSTFSPVSHTFFPPPSENPFSTFVSKRKVKVF